MITDSKCNGIYAWSKGVVKMEGGMVRGCVDGGVTSSGNATRVEVSTRCAYFCRGCGETELSAFMIDCAIAVEGRDGRGQWIRDRSSGRGGCARRGMYGAWQQ
jgi:hypothetical protein